MELEKLMPLIISGVSALVAGVSVCYIRKANKLIALQLESHIRTRVDESRKDLSAAIFNLSNNRKDEVLIGLKKVAIEGHLNAFDYACQKYLNKELNKKNFKEMYYYEIKIIYEGNSYSDQMKKIDYTAIRKVYEKIRREKL